MIVSNKEDKKTLARMIGHLMGDGCVTKRYFAYYNKNDVLLDNYEMDLRNLFGDIHIIKGKVNSGTKLIQVQNKKIINSLYLILDDFRSSSLKIPSFIDKKYLKKEFLKALYDDEVCVALRVFKKTNEFKRNLDISSKSYKFLESIKNILENDFNIRCNKIIFFKKKIHNKEFITWKLSITGRENFIKFNNMIGFTHPEKTKKLSTLIYSYSLKNKKHKV